MNQVQNNQAVYLASSQATTKSFDILLFAICYSSRTPIFNTLSKKILAPTKPRSNGCVRPSEIISYP